MLQIEKENANIWQYEVGINANTVNFVRSWKPWLDNVKTYPNIVLQKSAMPVFFSHKNVCKFTQVGIVNISFK